MTQFQIDLEKFAKDADPSVVIRKSALDLFTGVIKKTPVRSGRARGNWQTSVISPKNGILGIRSESNAIADATTTVLSAKDDEKIYLANNLPYINRLEHGWSKQAPAGMVEITMMEMPQFIKKAAK